MKHILSVLSMIVSYMGAGICSIWMSVEFLIYFFKDKEFNWLSVWLLIGFIMLTIITLTINSLFLIKRNFTDQDRYKNYRKSNFNSRLQEAIKNKSSKVAP